MLEGGRRIQQKWILFAIVAFSAVIMLAALPAKSLWLDETFTANVTPQVDGPISPMQVVELTLQGNERRPPLYFLVIFYWAFFAGNSEFAVRFPSVFFSLLSICLLVRLTKSLKMADLAPLAAIILALSPTFVMYSRMARAYSMPVCVSLLSTILFVELLRRPSRSLWIGYVVVSAVLLNTDYVLWVLLLAQNVYALYHIIAGRALPIRQWLVAQVFAFLLFVPGFVILVRQPGAISGEADLSGGPLGVVIRMVYQVYSALAGETIFPWRPLAIAGLVCAAIVAACGIVALLRNSQSRLVVFFLGTSVIICNVVLTILAPGWSFMYVPSHTLFIWPFVALVFAAGLASIHARSWRILAGATLALVWGVGLYNYATNQDFQNPVYIMPSREVTAQIIRASQPGDVIITEIDSAVDYYFGRTAAKPPGVSSFDVTTNLKQAEQVLSAERSPRIWLVTIGRDNTRAAAVTDHFSGLLKTSYMLEMSRGYVEQDALYRSFKEWLLKRPAYQYKLLVQLYVRK